MNRKKLIILALFLAAFGFILRNTTVQNTIIPPLGGDAFILGAMNNFEDANYSHISNPDEFGMNLWHHYSSSTYNSITDKHYLRGWFFGDTLFTTGNDYADSVKLILDTNEHHGMKTLLERPKIEWLCYGQRSDYQCEEEQNVNPNYWFYSFQRHKTGRDVQDNSGYGENQWVRYCRASNSTNSGNWIDYADTVAARLKSNNEQSAYGPSDGFNSKGDNESRWLIKPKIRIDKDFANEPANFNTMVCRIDVYDAHGYDPNNPALNRIKSIDIRVRNLRQDQFTDYDGNYTEEFNFGSPWNDTSTNDIQGAWSNSGLKTSRGRVMPDDPDTNLCKADIRVYWYGNVDMWIDYVRVDNEVADQLFKHERDDWLQWEVELADYAPNAYKFYIEEFQFNNLPCMAYVNKYLESHTTNHVGLMACFYWYVFTNHLNWYGYQRTGNWTDSKKLDKEIIKTVLMDSTGMDVFFTETYPFTGNDISQSPFSKVPNTLTPSTDNGECMLANQVSPAEYDSWLQVQLDNNLVYPAYNGGNAPPVQYVDPGWQGWTLRLANDYSKTYGKPFINMPQAHQYRNPGVEVRREPTTEETELEANLSLSYGSKGLIFFWYGGFSDCNSTIEYGKGFTNDGSNNIPREKNTYSQWKWDSLISLHKKINKWAPFFYSFNPQYTSSYTYQLERTNLLSQTYFNDIYTYKTGSGPVNCTDEFPDGESAPSGLIGECREDRYVQAAVFKNTIETNPNYFMIVNRRCSPYKNESSEDNRGGKRVIKLCSMPATLTLQGSATGIYMTLQI